MNREIKFRGKTENNKFIFGDLILYENGDTAIFEKKLTKYGCEATEICNRTKVDAETIGQFTGLCDKNGREIYEGDILQVLGNKITLTVVFDKAAFKFAWNDLSGEFFPAEWVSNCTIIGNIYDNAELLEEAK